MPDPRPEQRVLHAFTSEQWSGQPAKDAGSMFAGSAIIGAALCLVLMIFVPGLRNGGAFTLFTAAFAILFTALAVKGKASAERKFLAALTATLNETIVGLTGNPEHRLSVQQFRALIERGAPLPLPVNGVPGLELQAVREKPAVQLRNAAGKRVEQAAHTTRIVIKATPPDYGITSFNHLLAAATEADGSNGGGVP